MPRGAGQVRNSDGRRFHCWRYVLRTYGYLGEKVIQPLVDLLGGLDMVARTDIIDDRIRTILVRPDIRIGPSRRSHDISGSRQTEGCAKRPSLLLHEFVIDFDSYPGLGRVRRLHWHRRRTAGRRQAALGISMTVYPMGCSSKPVVDLTCYAVLCFSY
jgi:hypothetical protein